MPSNVTRPWQRSRTYTPKGGQVHALERIWLTGRVIFGFRARAGIAIQRRRCHTFNQQIPFSIVTVNPCPPGNPLSETGNIHIMGSLTSDSAGGIHGNLSSNLDNFSAVDQVTRTTYQGQTNGQTSGG